MARRPRKKQFQPPPEASLPNAMNSGLSISLLENMEELKNCKEETTFTRVIQNPCGFVSGPGSPWGNEQILKFGYSSNVENLSPAEIFQKEAKDWNAPE
jgi:hypothetical protein